MQIVFVFIMACKEVPRPLVATDHYHSTFKLLFWCRRHLSKHPNYRRITYFLLCVQKCVNHFGHPSLYPAEGECEDPKPLNPKH